MLSVQDHYRAKHYHGISNAEFTQICLFHDIKIFFSHEPTGIIWHTSSQVVFKRKN